MPRESATARQQNGKANGATAGGQRPVAGEPGAHYVLVSTREHGNNPGPVEFRSYRIVEGNVTEEEVNVVEALPST